MPTSNRQFRPDLRLAMVFLSLSASIGCLNPYYGMGGYGYPGQYRQPSYAPPASLNANPGSLYIPESSGAPYVPENTYDSEPGDDFEKSDDSPYYGVPTPKDLENNLFDEDMGARSDHPTFSADNNIRQVSGSYSTVDEFGFDYQHYSFLKGILRYTGSTWSVNYSPAARDQYSGSLALSMSAAQAQNLADGDLVEVFGHVDDSSGYGPVYRVESIRIVE